LKVLLLSNDIGNLYRFRSALIREFVSRGYQVFAAAPPQPGPYQARIEKLGAIFCPWDIRRTGRNPLPDLVAVVKLAQLLRRIRPEIFFGYTIKPVIYGMLAARLVGVPWRTAMITGLGYAFMHGEKLGGRITQGLGWLGYRVALSQANVVLFQNDDDIASFRAWGLLGGHLRVGRVNGSGVDIEQYSEKPLLEGPPVFLMMARLLRDKGVYEFIEAARRVRRRLPSARFLLVGAPDANPTAVRQSEVDGWVAEGLIDYRGHLEDPRPALAEANIFVLPSYREGTPRVNLEAMATGRAIITTDVVGCRETVVDGVTGLLVPARDAIALAEAMIRLGSDLALAARMGKAGRRLCEERFESAAVAAETASLLEAKDLPGIGAPAGRCLRDEAHI
jgi:glycosyltransferase involved in cell wall biosynthesis